MALFQCSQKEKFKRIIERNISLYLIFADAFKKSRDFFLKQACNFICNATMPLQSNKAQ